MADPDQRRTRMSPDSLTARIPLPREPQAAVVRPPAPPAELESPDGPTPTFHDRCALDRFWPRVDTVAVWTIPHGHWQEYASFVLLSPDQGARLIGFAEPLATDLVATLSAEAGFDHDRLFELIGTHTSGLFVLWSRSRYSQA